MRLSVDELLEVLGGVMERHRSYDIGGSPPNPHPTRGVCTVDGCVRPTVASGFCNAHYLRHRKGGDMTAPIRAAYVERDCVRCLAPLDANGGWGYCRGCYKTVRFRAIKAALIEALGGCCSICEGVYPQEVYDFHHVDTSEKDISPSEVIGNRSLQGIANEISKCQLVCANCHRVIHGGGIFYE